MRPYLGLDEAPEDLINARVTKVSNVLFNSSDAIDVPSSWAV